jgi:hypothetical protein
VTCCDVDRRCLILGVLAQSFAIRCLGDAARSGRPHGRRPDDDRDDRPGEGRRLRGDCLYQFPLQIVQGLATVLLWPPGVVAHEVPILLELPLTGLALLIFTQTLLFYLCLFGPGVVEFFLDFSRFFFEPAPRGLCLFALLLELSNQSIALFLFLFGFRAFYKALASPIWCN